MKQQEALDILKLGKNVFLTGAAGAGKTYLLNSYIGYLRDRGVKVAVTASTGIAATHLGGQTIHSWSGIGIKDELTDEALLKIVKNQRVKRNFRRTKVLVIDEISMLHARQLDMVEEVARAITGGYESFGGLQVVLSGDFFQLPPVVQGDTNCQFAFESSAWVRGEFQICYLKEQFRQRDDPLLDVLNSIRNGNVGEHTKIPLRTRYKKEPVGVNGADLRPTRLYARNINVDRINQRELEALPGKTATFQMTSAGPEKLVEGLKKGCLAPEELKLKLGAQVLFVKNSLDGSYVNGTRGVVQEFSELDDWPVVRTLSGREILTTPQDWQLVEDDLVRASISQVPLRLAWAITIHKSQGMTLDSAEVDLSDAFEPGMGYVALSRVRKLDGLKLLGLNEMAFKVNQRVLGVDSAMQQGAKEALDQLAAIPLEEKLAKQRRVLCDRLDGVWEVGEEARGEEDFGGGKLVGARKIKGAEQREPKIPASEHVAELVRMGLPLEAMAEQRGVKVTTILSHLEKLKSKGQLPCIEYLRHSVAEKDFQMITAELQSSEDGLLKPIFERFNGEYDYLTIRLVRLFRG